MDRALGVGRFAGLSDHRAVETGVVFMTANVWIQVGIYVAVLVALVKPLGWYLARGFEGGPCGLDRGLGWLERLIYRLAGIDPRREMTWKTYAVAVLTFNILGVALLYALLRLQNFLPLNPQGFPANTPD